MQKNLIVVGSGIKSISHLSIEAIAYIKQSQKILYSINEPVLQKWIHKHNPNAESLDKNIEIGLLRSTYYQRITEYILENFRNYTQICVVIYGHPTVFAAPALNAAIEAKKRGIIARILPAISAEACLFADLLIDPGSCGCQSYEATDFLIHQRPVNNLSHLILWQVGFIGALGNIAFHNNSKGINSLTDYLLCFYDHDHEIIIYEAAMYPHLEPKIKNIALNFLPNIPLSSLSTMYIPPSKLAMLDDYMLETLQINREHL